MLLFSCENPKAKNKKEELSQQKLENDVLFGQYSLEERNSRAEAKLVEALDFCSKKGYSTSYCFLIDLGVHSGLNRFYVYNLDDKKLIKKGSVSHGCGKLPWGRCFSKDDAEFSNESNSHLSSLGKYRVGARYASQWGIKVGYLLYGLESTNSNALKREVVLHSWDVIIDEEVPRGTPEGWGCPAVSNAFMTGLDEDLKAIKKPVLMWIFN